MTSHTSFNRLDLYDRMDTLKVSPGDVLSEDKRRGGLTRSDVARAVAGESAKLGGIG